MKIYYVSIPQEQTVSIFIVKILLSDIFVAFPH